jgi:putative ABC transport system permease protein
MSWLDRLRRRTRMLLHPDVVDREMDEEMRFHLEMESEERMRFGATPADARRTARLSFGGVDRYKEEGREARTGRWWEELRQDARYSARVLSRSRGFATIGILTLALGIGADTAIFSVVRGVLLRPLPYADPERLVAVQSVIRGTPTAVSPPDFVDWRAQTHAFSSLAAFFVSTTNLTGSGDAERLTQARVSSNFFDLIGMQPALGRGFRPGEDRVDAPRVAVLSDGLWRRRFGADTSIIGRTIILDDSPTMVIGVAPPQLILPADDHAVARQDQWVDLWLTTRFSPRDVAPSSRGARWIEVIGRLAPGAALETARAEMRTIAARLATADPRHDDGVTTLVVPLREELVGGMRTPLLVLLGAVAFVMLIACVNVASLSLGRTAARRTELAVRVALGASRRRIARQMLTESLALSLGGGIAGVVLAWTGTRALVALAPGDLALGGSVHLDGVVLAFATAVTVGSGLLFGIVPAVHGARHDAQEGLRSGGRGGSGAGDRARRGLVVGEVALAITLLAGAGLLLRSFARLTTIDPGFRAAGVTTFSLELSPVRYPRPTEQAQFANELLARVQRLPGVADAGISFDLPLSNSAFGLTFAITGRPEVSGPEEPRAQVRVASPRYFQVMGIPLLRGRGFTDADRAGTPRVLLVSAEAARRYWPNENPIGQTLTTGWSRDSVHYGGTIVGVVGDVRQFALSLEPAPEIYAPLAQWPLDEMSVVVRSSLPPAAVLTATREVVRELDAELPMYNAYPLENVVRDSVATRRFYALLLASFAGLALVLAAIGIYGVISYAVQQRRRELGIRVALGASRERVITMVMRQGMILAIAGAVIGLVASAALTRVLAGQLFGVSATDPLTFAAVPFLLLVVAAGACVVPVRRALRVDPATAIRSED